jgi:hypothetical protein
MSRTVTYKPPLISRRTYQLAAVALLILGFVLFSDFIGMRGPSEERTPVPEAFGILFILAGAVTYIFGRRWINCPHCSKEVKRVEAVCPNCGKRIFGETT